MRRASLTWIGLAVALALVVPLPLARAQKRQPVYVGSRACAQCHDGAGMGHQYSRWLASRHAEAYASLRLPSARKMAELSGVTQDPHEALICLGCHATAAEAEPWERDPTFDITDGVQCEKCHGPGSEYMDAAVMADREAAMAAGLRIQPKQVCMKCHYVKGSHVSVHKKPPLDLETAWKRIDHATPPGAKPDGLSAPAQAEPLPGPKYVGVHACAQCHNTAAMNRQASAWRMSAHARAWASLALPRAVEIARQMSVTGEPQKAPACLKCHATGYGQAPGRLLPGATIDEGVTCEACHGPGSEYQREAAMRHPAAARRAGLTAAGPATCGHCHASAHGKPFDVAAAMRAIAHPHKPRPVTEASLFQNLRYKTPRNLAMRPDGAEVWVACEGADSVAVVDARRDIKVAEIPVGGQPNDVAFAPDGRRAYVSNRLDDNVSVVDVATRKTVATIAVGDEPHGLTLSRDGRRLYVVNTSSDDISVVDIASRKEVRRLAASRKPWSVALSPDGTRALVTNALSRFVPFRRPSLSEVTVVHAEQGRIADRLLVPEGNLLQGVAWHPSGRFALFTLNRTKNLVPMTRILQGWTITNGLGIAWRDGRVDQILLDEPNHYFADSANVAITPDGRLAFVTSQGTNRVAVVDVARLLGVIEQASDRERKEVVPNHLGKSTDFVLKHIPTRDAPRGVVATPDGRQVFVVNMLDDSLTVIDVKSLTAVARVDLGGPRQVNKIRWGQKLFHSANVAFQRQFSCASCHPDGHVDGLTYDVEADGIGVSPVDNRTLRGIYDTDPFKWEGTNPSLARQCGARLAVFFTRVAPFTPEELSAVNDYTVTIPRPPNRHRPFGAELTPAQARGKAIFERTHTNDGREIPLDNRCVTCHFAPYYTDRSRRDVGSKYTYDRQGSFDVPHLNNIYDSAPYMHNGMADTLEEIWTRFNPYDTHGVTNDMTKDQLNDLIEYLKTL